MISRPSIVDPDSAPAAMGRGLCEFDQRLLRIVEHAQQHRQVQPGDAMDRQARLGNPLGDVARGCAVDIGQHEHAIA